MVKLDRFLLFTFLILSHLSFGQNIIPNPSFEQKSDCPDHWSISEIDQLERCNFWYNVTQASPDFYHQCAISTVGIPSNHLGSESPMDGKAYLGFYAYVSTHEWYEYLGVDFKPMEAGSAYLVSISISLADSSRLGADGIGIYFYDQEDKINVNTSKCLRLDPQVDFSDEGPIIKKDGWVTLSRIYYPEKNFGKLIIGSFKDPNSINLIDTGFGHKKSAHYYLDQVIVEKIPEL